MFLNTLDRKNFIKKQDGNVIRDLTSSMFDFKSNNYTSYSMFRVSPDYIMRPDLISQASYNNILYAEYILKYNGISNPFTIDKDDIILIPNLESVQKNTRIAENAEVDNDPSKRLRESYRYIDPTKIPKKDGTSNNFNDRNFTDNAKNNETVNKQELTDGALPPNIAEAGTSQIVERNGRIYFGEGIGESACLQSGMSSSEFLTKVIKSKKV